VIAEFGGSDLLLLIDGAGEFRLRDLLPHAFSLAEPPGTSQQ
jgi:hypothetical protein